MDKEFMPTRRKKRKSVRAARLDIRLNPQVKEKIEQAAVVSHQSLTDSVVTSLLRVSEEALQRQRMINSVTAIAISFTALEADVRPNRALRKAVGRFNCSQH
jgi:uncharacterized protein (DUF1778 family)